MALRVLITNNKGGEGKSLTVANVAYALAATERRVLVVDMDPQCIITERLGHDPLAEEYRHRPGIAQVLDPDTPMPIKQVLLPCAWNDPVAQRIDLVPSLAVIPLERRAKEAGELGAVNRLRTALDGFDDGYHFTLIDAGPSLSHLWDNSAAAAEHIVIVSKPEKDGLKAGLRVLDYVETRRGDLGRPDLRVVGVVINDYDEAAEAHRYNLQNLPSRLAALHWGTIPHRLTLIASMNDSRPIAALTHTAARSATDIYRTFAQRLIELEASA